jgi:hypothetical protein
VFEEVQVAFAAQVPVPQADELVLHQSPALKEASDVLLDPPRAVEPPEPIVVAPPESVAPPEPTIPAVPSIPPVPVVAIGLEVPPVLNVPPTTEASIALDVPAVPDIPPVADAAIALASPSTVTKPPVPVEPSALFRPRPLPLLLLQAANPTPANVERTSGNAYLSHIGASIRCAVYHSGPEIARSVGAGTGAIAQPGPRVLCDRR